LRFYLVALAANARPKCRAFSSEPEYDSESKQDVVSPLPGHLLKPIKGALPWLSYRIKSASESFERIAEEHQLSRSE
jgi:hypothetical protein